jgi:hypothetical protein
MLRDLVRTRLDGFAAGKLYSFERIVPPHPEQFLWFEFGLLLGVLTTDLDSATGAEDYWERIVPPLIRQVSPDISDARMEEIEMAARAYRDSWVKHYQADDAPLAEILGFTMLAAFDCHDEDHEYRRVIVRETAGTLLETTSEFLDIYRDILYPERHSEP